MVCTGGAFPVRVSDDLITWHTTHGTVLRVHERDYFFHHAWPALPNGKHDLSKGRFGLLAPITWAADGWPSVGGSSVTTQMLWP